ncbi:MAG TPA: hypothetical protein VGQ59_12725 [Cyclobacteriaceae bacterium]|jgi:hypothetical protein|nr:hypothetical protein [Cyclobacteriaceae bacterium]
MKLKRTLAIVVWIIFSVPAIAQVTKDVFDTKESVVWLGLDFTGAKFQGEREDFGSNADIEKLILAWNTLMINEPLKYDMGKALHRQLLKNVVGIAIAHNTELNLKGRVESDSKNFLHLDKAAISRIVSSYDFVTEQGIGVMFVVESFNKIDKKGSAWLTFVNLNTKEVLFTERVTGKPAGFGVRNYWAGSIYNMQKQVQSNYNLWKRKYTI